MTKTEKELLDTIKDLVDLYVANVGNPKSEFISCITPGHINEMPRSERKKNKIWSAWDRARMAMCRAKPELKKDYWPIMPEYKWKNGTSYLADDKLIPMEWKKRVH